jgi:hypothetical protein
MKQETSKLIKPRTIFTALFFIATAYLFIVDIKVPDFLKLIDTSLLGYYFGEKAIRETKKG